MKTAIQWELELDRACESRGGFDSNDEILDFIKQIQLDAFKAGMRRAAKVASKTYESPMKLNEKAILTAAEQLTEKDLPNS